ncbi:hypothetical protein CEXT_665601 [Caerostris extrusa]|uniref:Uncharacterized protein n=1 Tax=Caerostris extrusa TaxID=172846 RepID=A0AAV4XMX7_CAEEX|nr:hypothetical protein CEXT_665601 [Caerostris extrusa]
MVRMENSQGEVVNYGLMQHFLLALHKGEEKSKSRCLSSRSPRILMENLRSPVKISLFSGFLAHCGAPGNKKRTTWQRSVL